jgi:hypothetical protein
LIFGVRELRFARPVPPLREANAQTNPDFYREQKSFHLTDPKENCEAITNTYKNNKEVSNFNFFSPTL